MDKIPNSRIRKIRSWIPGPGEADLLPIKANSDEPQKPLLDLASNDYLGLSRHPAIVEATQTTLREEEEHKFTSFVEIYQNCPIFNDGTFSEISERSLREDRILRLQDGQPLLFGKEQNKGIRLKGLKPEIVDVNENTDPSELLVHDQKSEDPLMAHLLSGMNLPDFPVPMGVFRQVKHPRFEESVEEQIQNQIEKKGKGDLRKLIRGPQVWEA